MDLVLTRLQECNLKLSADKCFFAQKKVKFLGHVVSEFGVETDPAKTEKVKNWPVPNNPDEVRSFVSFAGYYRRFVKDFSKVARPLTDLLPPTTRAKNKKKVQKEWRWTEEEQTAFESLKDHLTKPPILAYPDFEQPFELHIDGCGDRPGGSSVQPTRQPEESNRLRLPKFIEVGTELLSVQVGVPGTEVGSHREIFRLSDRSTFLCTDG